MARSCTISIDPKHGPRHGTLKIGRPVQKNLRNNFESSKRKLTNINQCFDSVSVRSNGEVEKSKT